MRIRVCALLILLGWSLPLRADLRSYARGVEAARDGDWTKVQTLMSAALANDAEPRDRVRLYGQYFRPYIPQYYLALAADARKDCVTALRQLDDARLMSVLAGGKQAAAEATEVGAIRRRCSTPMAQNPPPVIPDPTPTPSLNAGQRQQLTQAGQRLAQARREAEAKVPVQQLGPALIQAAQAQAALDNVTEPAQLERVLALARNATTALQQAVLAAAPVANPTTPKADPVPVPRPPASDPEPSGPAPALRAALEAWLAGDSAAVLRTATTGMDPRSAAHTLLLRAAVRHTQYVLGGERDANLRALAETDVREARRQWRDLRPSTRWYSPRFRAFFEAVR